LKYLVTSNDWALAGSVYLTLLSRDRDWTFVNVVARDGCNLLSYQNLSKKVKLTVLFGVSGTVRILFQHIQNKKKINMLPAAKVITVSHEKFEKGIGFKNTDFVVLVNYPWLIKMDFWTKILNFHPGPLPEYRGLMPICYQVWEALKQGKKSFKVFYSLHWIDERFDNGPLVVSGGVSVTHFSSLLRVYQCVYSRAADEILSALCATPGKVEASSAKGRYLSAMSLRQTLSFKALLLRVDVFVRFLINGGSIGVISWGLQILIYNFLLTINTLTQYAGLLSVYISFCLVLLLAFFSMKTFVFQRAGLWHRFLLSAGLIIIFVGLCTELLISFFDFVGLSSGYSHVAYPLAAILFAPLSYALKNFFVFPKK